MVNTMLIKVAEQISKNAVTQKAGAQLFNMIHDDLKKENHVSIDFSGVEVYSSPFFNISIGRLYADIDETTIKNHLEIRYITPVGSQVLRSVIENAKRYYALTPEEKSKQDQVDREFFADEDFM